MIESNYIKLYEKSFCDNWELPALTNYDTGESYIFAQVAEAIARWHIYFEQLGLHEGDKVALMGKDSAEWCIFFMAVLTYGAVIVPVLQDFNKIDVEAIIAHSDAKLLMIGANLAKLDLSENKALVAVLEMGAKAKYLQQEDPSNAKTEALQAAIEATFAERYPSGFSKEDIRYAERSNSELALINYTSGTTGFSKGVMLSGNVLAGNVTYAHSLDLMFRGEQILCFLPMAHTYSCAFNFLTPMSLGTHVYILGKSPTPQVLLKAFADVKPTLIISVPLILEKIYFNQILPKIRTRKMRRLLRVPFMRTMIARKIKESLVNSLGGNFRELIVGGAPLNDEVGAFLHRIGFPLTVGYGMTECGPLICYENNRLWKPGSCGKSLKTMELRIAEVELLQTQVDSRIGEIQTRGEHLCMGYYKNEELTKALFTEDGWMRTGDLGYIDRAGDVFIKGRSKTMILGPSGQNIYPEEIESKINSLPYVLESVLVERSGKLVAIVVPNELAVRAAGLSLDEAWKAIEASRTELNEQVAQYERVQRFERRDTEFEKTPKRSIKRFLYT